MAIWGAGPVGLMVAMSARLRDADQVFVVDRQPDRLKLVEAIDATPIDDNSGNAGDEILQATRGGSGPRSGDRRLSSARPSR